MTKTVAPSINKTAFSCPHCGAYTTQFWHKLYAVRLSKESPIPFVPSEADKERFAKDPTLSKEILEEILEMTEKLQTGLVFFKYHKDSTSCYNEAKNLSITRCYNCTKFAVWVSNRLLFPGKKVEISPNPDLPTDIQCDYEEAREIADASPRGSAALLRLCIQKLCKHLGESGKNIDADIGSLVKKGLDPLVQKSLDIVRVIGNEAVHPGVIDLKDDRDTTNRLFELINAIAVQMITHPNTVKAMYERLPETKRRAIEKRDNKQ